MNIPFKLVADLDYEEGKKLAWLTGLSQFLTSFIISEGNVKELLNPEEESISVEKHLEKLSENRTHDFLIKYKYRELVRIAIMEMKGIENYENTLRELSSLYDSLIIATYNMVREEKDPLLIYALGKLGGQEINLSSDVDILLISRDDEEIETALKVAKKLLSTLSEKKMGRFILRPDINLRPYGRFSPPVTSLSRAVEYYFTRAEVWERYALIRLRLLYGFNDEFSSIAEKFVFRRYLDITAVEEIYKLKKKIEVEEEKGKEWNVKLGRGGIRELEFLLQSYQILYGGKNPALRERNTFKLIRALAESGIVDQKTANELIFRYSFLRKLENAIQWENEVQTHKLPSNPALRKVISKKMLMNDKEFEDELEITIKFVRDLFEKTFKISNEKGFSLPLSEVEIKNFVPHLSESERKSLQEELNSLSEGMGIKKLEKISRIVESVLEIAKNKSTPYNVIHKFIEFLSSLSRFPPYLGFIAEKNEIVEYLMEIISKSKYISDFLSKEPYLLENLLTLEEVQFDINFIKEELIRKLSALDNLEEITEEINRVKNEFMLYIMIKDMVHNCDIVKVFEYLTILADAIVWACLGIARHIAVGGKSIEKSLKETDDFPLLVVGMGKYGGRELNYYSDLDLIFIYRDEDHHTTMAKIAQKLLFLLTTPTMHGTLYKTDTRLRPSGRAGQLVSSISSFKNYHRRSSQTWEKQSLIKSRPVAGSSEIWKEMENFMKEEIFAGIEKEKVREDIVEMRKRLLTREYKKDSWDLKIMEGGIVDIEFTVQFLQLINIPKEQSLLTPSTLDAIDKLKWAKILEESDFSTLKGRYLFLRDVERSLRLMTGRSDDLLKREQVGEILKLLKTKFKSEEEFIGELIRGREEIKNLYKKLVAL